MRVYVDTNVFGPYSSGQVEEVQVARHLFNAINGGVHRLVTSELVEAELLGAPVSVRDLFVQLTLVAEWVPLSDEAGRLRDAYINAGVVTARHRVDALHVAIATVAGCPILSWNRRQFSNKADAYNEVNNLTGYGTIDVVTPKRFFELYI
jgi:predicted nucleic acid-binding protein